MSKTLLSIVAAGILTISTGEVFAQDITRQMPDFEEIHNAIPQFERDYKDSLDEHKKFDDRFGFRVSYKTIDKKVFMVVEKYMKCPKGNINVLHYDKETGIINVDYKTLHGLEEPDGIPDIRIRVDDFENKYFQAIKELDNKKEIKLVGFFDLPSPRNCPSYFYA